MSDKAREDFDEWFESTGINRTFSEALFSPWLAAKEKYEPRWISCVDRFPEIGDYSVMALWNNGGIDMVHVQDFFDDITAGLDEHGEQLYTKWYLTSGVTAWMPLPSEPSTQGGGE